MSIPLIGVTTYRTLNKFGFTQSSVSEAYTSSLTNAGAVPLLIPVGLPESALDALIPRLDGILFTGGGDIDPQRYGGEPHPLVSDVDIDRDRIEIYRPLLADPKEVRKRRAAQGLRMKKGGGKEEEGESPAE